MAIGEGCLSVEGGQMEAAAGTDSVTVVIDRRRRFRSEMRVADVPISQVITGWTDWRGDAHDYHHRAKQEHC